MRVVEVEAESEVPELKGKVFFGNIARSWDNFVKGVVTLLLRKRCR